MRHQKVFHAEDPSLPDWLGRHYGGIVIAGVAIGIPGHIAYRNL